MISDWLPVMSQACLLAGIAFAIVIATDLARHPQRMWIMNVVWPVNALFGTVLTLWLYYRFGRLASRDADEKMRVDKKRKTPFPIMVAKGAMHCGAGCALGDLIAESLALVFPVI